MRRRARLTVLLMAAMHELMLQFMLNLLEGLDRLLLRRVRRAEIDSFGGGLRSCQLRHVVSRDIAGIGILTLCPVLCLIFEPGYRGELALQ